jgi:hypothetical protein
LEKIMEADISTWHKTGHFYFALTYSSLMNRNRSLSGSLKAGLRLEKRRDGFLPAILIYVAAWKTAGGTPALRVHGCRR